MTKNESMHLFFLVGIYVLAFAISVQVHEVRKRVRGLEDRECAPVGSRR